MRTERMLKTIQPRRRESITQPGQTGDHQPIVVIAGLHRFPVTDPRRFGVAAKQSRGGDRFADARIGPCHKDGHSFTNFRVYCRAARRPARIATSDCSAPTKRGSSSRP